MASKTVYKSVRVRRSPVPRKSGGGFFAMLSRLASASDSLNKARRKR